MAQLYRLLTGEDSSEFCHKVSLALARGWCLYGDPQYSYDGQTSKMRCAQAVIKNVSQDYDADMKFCLLYTSPSPRDATLSRMPSSA